MTLEVVSRQADISAETEGGSSSESWTLLDAAPFSDVMASALTERHALLRDLMSSDPATVLRVVLPEEVRAALQPGLSWPLERAVELVGELEVLVEDWDNGRSRERQVLLVNGTRYELQAEQPIPGAVSGQRVRVRGVLLDRDLAVERVSPAGANVPAGETPPGVPPDSVSPAPDQATDAAVELAGSRGSQSTLFILVNFRDKVVQPITPADAQSLLFSTVDGFYRENSQDQAWFTGRVAGYYTIPMDSTVCDSGAIRTYAQNAASRAGIDLSRYTRFVYGFPKNKCGWSGLGQVGGFITHAWVNGAFTPRVVAHELGHNFGLRHAHALECGATTLGADCSTINYGDWADVMGKNVVAHFNAFAKERLGWLNASSSPPITTVTSSGTYSVQPYSGAAIGPRALKILKSVDRTSGARTWYYVEQRVAAGFDTSLAGNANIMNGALVHTGDELSADTGFVLDMTPETTSWKDPALPVGRVFDDPDAGVRLTTVASGSTGGRIRVDLTAPPCARSTPGFTMTPDATQWGAPGAGRNWTLTVTNRDDVMCAPRLFTLGASAPAGWGAALSVAALTLEPGTTGKATLGVTAPATAAQGFYAVSASATPDTGSAFSDAGTFAVSTAFSVTVATDATTYTRSGTVTMTARVLGAGSPAVGVPVTFTMTRADGTTTAVTVITDATGRSTYALGLQGKDPVGTWRVLARASSGGVTGSASTSFTVR